MRCLGFEKLRQPSRNGFEEDLNKHELQQKRSSWKAESPKSWLGWVLRGRKIAHKIYEYFRVAGTRESILDFTDLMNVTLRGDDVGGKETKWDEHILSMQKTAGFCFEKVSTKRGSEIRNK